MIKLTQSPMWGWTTFGDLVSPMSFKTIEEASTYLEKMGVKDEAIDESLISMSVNAHNRAVFGDDGSLLQTTKV